MKTLAKLLKIAVLGYSLAFAFHATNRFLAQRDEMVTIEKMNSVLKAVELQGNVHCSPS
jgi:hypothetical protein